MTDFVGNTRPRKAGRAYLARLRVRAVAERGPIARSAMWVRLSEAYTDIGKSWLALACAEQAQQAAGDHAVSMRLSEALAVTHREEEALEVLARLEYEAHPSIVLRARVLSAEIAGRRGMTVHAARMWRALLGRDPQAHERYWAFGSVSGAPPPRAEDAPADATERPRWHRAWHESRPADVACAEEAAALYLTAGEVGSALYLWSEFARGIESPEVGLLRGVEIAVRENRNTELVAWYILHERLARRSEVMPKLVRALREVGLGPLEHLALVRDVETGTGVDSMAYRRALAAEQEAAGQGFNAGAELWRAPGLLTESERQQALEALGFGPRSVSGDLTRSELVSLLRAGELPEAGAHKSILDSLLGYPDLQEGYARLATEIWTYEPTGETALHALRAAVLSENASLEDEVVTWLTMAQSGASWDAWLVRAAWRRGDMARAMACALAARDASSAPVVYWARVVRAAEAAHDAAEEARAWCKLAQVCDPSAKGILLSAAVRASAAAGESTEAVRLAEEAIASGSSVISRMGALRFLVEEGAGARTPARWVEVILEAKPPRAQWLGAVYALAQLRESGVVQELLRAYQSDRYVCSEGLRAMVNLTLHASDAATVRQLFQGLTQTSGAPRRDVAELALAVLPVFLHSDLRAAEFAAQEWLRVSGLDTFALLESLLAIAEVAGSDRLASSALMSALDRLQLAPMQRSELWSALAARHAALGDADSEAMCVADALMDAPSAHPDLDTWAAQLLNDERGVGADARLSLAESVAERAHRGWLTESGSGAARREDVERAWRNLGRLKWELAEDRDGAMEAWGVAAQIGASDSAMRDLAQLSVEAFGPTLAFDALSRFAEKLPSGGSQVRLQLQLAELALQSQGRGELAFRYARECVTHLTEGVRAIAICEQSRAVNLALSEVYETMANAATGHHAARAVYARASLHFERTGQGALAFEHALRALAADARSESAVQRVIHTVSWAHEPDRAVSALEKASGRVKDRAKRVELRIAAAVVLAACEGQAARALTRLVDALVTTSECAFALGLKRIAPHAGSIPRTSRDAAARELDRALDVVAREDDATLASSSALAVSLFASEMGHSTAALRGLAIGLSKDSAVSGYTLLLPHLPVLLKASGVAALVGRVAGDILRWPNVSIDALKLLAQLAAHAEARSAQARFLLRRAELTELPADRAAAIEASQGVPDKALAERVSWLSKGLAEEPATRDHGAYVVALAERIVREQDGDARMLLRLRRAAVLYDRLGRDDDAVSELQAALAEHPNHEGARAFLLSIRGDEV